MESWQSFRMAMDTGMGWKGKMIARRIKMVQRRRKKAKHFDKIKMKAWVAGVR